MMMRTGALLLALLSAVAPAQNAGPRGDVTGDGAVSAADAQAVLAHVVAIALPVGLAPTPWGDANCNGTVEAVDAQIILTRTVGGDVGTACVGTPLARVVTIETSTPATNLAIGGSATIAVTVRDSAGVELTGRVVRFVSSSPATATVNAGGAVTGAAAGAVTITVFGEQQANPVTFSVADAAGAITLVSGNLQVGFAGKNLLDKIRVRVTDGLGTPVPAKAVAVTILKGGGSLVGSPVTNADGEAELTYQLGGVGENVFSVNTSDGPSQIALTLRADAVPSGDRIAGGFRHTCFIGADALTRCWGHNIGGVIANAAMTGDYSQTANNIATTPILADGGLQFRGLYSATVADGTGGFMCGLTNAGSAFCWGTNFDNALAVTSDQCPTGGTNPRACIRAPRLVSGLTFETLAPGMFLGRSRLCGIEPDGDALCWGDNTAGSLGTGDNASVGTPTLVTGNRKFVQMASGRAHTCALTLYGEVYCWGSNRNPGVANPQIVGQLGSLTTPDSSSTPILVSGIPRAVWLSAANNATCVGTGSGAVWCWGGLGVNAMVPTDVSGGIRFRTGRVGTGSMCGIAQDGLTYCYVPGAQAAGLGVPGNGLVTTSPVPRPITGGHQFGEIGSGSFHVCGVANADDLYCWGNSNGGQVGVGIQSLTVNVLSGILAPSKVIFGSRPTEAPSAMTAFSATTHSTAAGASITAPVAVRVTGPSGFGVPNATVRVFVRSGGGGLGASLAPSIVFGTDSAGIVGLKGVPDELWRLGDQPGPNRLVFKVDGATDSVVFTATGVTAGSPVRIIATTLLTSAGVTNTRHAATVVDAQGLPVRNVPVQFGAPAQDIGRTDPELPATIMTDNEGRATLNLLEVAHSAHLDSLTVSAPGVGNAFLRFSIAAAARARLSFLTQPKDAVAGQTMQSFAVAAQDEFGNTINLSQTVTLTLGGSSPNTTSLQGTLSASGNSTVNFANVRVSTAGANYQIVASATGVPSIASAPFTIAPAAGVNAVANRNPEAFAPVETPVATTPRVLVRDGSNAPVANVPVTFRVVAGGGTVTGATVLTDASGLAALGGWTLGPAPTPNIVEAAIPGAAPVRFTVDARHTLRLSVGPSDVCALDVAGATYCWGQNAFNSFGTTTPSRSLAPLLQPHVPTVSRLGPSLSQGHCGVNASNQWVCWGRGGSNELGETLGPAPGLVSTSINFKEVAMGRILSCGLDVANVTFCWALNQSGGFGRLADTIRAQRGPLATAPVDGNHVFVYITAGWQHSCGLEADGTAWCWGLNGAGELGVGFTGAIEHPSGSFTPQRVATTEKFRMILAGSRITCAINLAGRLFCWGFNPAGQLGDGSTTNRNVPTPVARELRFATVATNFSSASSAGVTAQAGSASTCALTDDGQAYCWGSNALGTLGDGTAVDKLVPTPVATTLRFSAIDMGDGHTCAMRGNQIWCWGNNSNGQVGDGTTVMRLTPTRVQTPF